jgi:hypothetical protein
MPFYKQFYHPVLPLKVVKKGFSVPAFFLSWLFFFYHKCFKAGSLLLCLNVATFAMVKFIEKKSFNAFKENDLSYQSAMNGFKRMEETENQGALNNMSQSETVDYYGTKLNLMIQTEDNVRWKFDRKYQSIFIILNCLLLLVTWTIFAFKSSSILEKAYASRGYKLNFQTEAPTKGTFLAMASDKRT